MKKEDLEKQTAIILTIEKEALEAKVEIYKKYLNRLLGKELYKVD